MTDTIVTTLRVSKDFMDSQIESLDTNDNAQTGFTDSQGFVTLKGNGNCTEGPVCDYVIRHLPAMTPAQVALYSGVTRSIANTLSEKDAVMFGSHIKALNDESVKLQASDAIDSTNATPPTRVQVGLEDGQIVVIEKALLDGILDHELAANISKNIITVATNQGVKSIPISSEDYQAIVEAATSSTDTPTSWKTYAAYGVAGVLGVTALFLGRKAKTERTRADIAEGQRDSLAQKVREEAMEVEGAPDEAAKVAAFSARFSTGAQGGTTGNLRSRIDSLVEEAHARAETKTNAEREKLERKTARKSDIVQKELDVASSGLKEAKKDFQRFQDKHEIDTKDADGNWDINHIEEAQRVKIKRGIDRHENEINDAQEKVNQLTRELQYAKEKERGGWFKRFYSTWYGKSITWLAGSGIATWLLNRLGINLLGGSMPAPGAQSPESPAQPPAAQ